MRRLSLLGQDETKMIDCTEVVSSGLARVRLRTLPLISLQIDPGAQDPHAPPSSPRRQVHEEHRGRGASARSCRPFDFADPPLRSALRLRSRLSPPTPARRPPSAPCKLFCLFFCTHTAHPHPRFRTAPSPTCKCASTCALHSTLTLRSLSRK